MKCMQGSSKFWFSLIKSPDPPVCVQRSDRVGARTARSQLHRYMVQGNETGQMLFKENMSWCDELNSSRQGPASLLLG